MSAVNSDIPDRERIAHIETAVDAMSAELKELRGAVKILAEKASAGRETNWSNVFLALGLAAAIYAAAIHPMQLEAERIQRDAQELARAVLVQNERAEDRDQQLAVIQYRLDHPLSKDPP